ncbi:MAG: CarD family transcriptional regulator [Eubacteriales bacterium]|nr:CarD family transcriptional regulator [Eubacteriales bacterium]
MYHEGEFIIYGTNGVCKVEAVGRPPFAGDEARLYYTLAPVFGTETIYIPVDSPVFMRPVLSKDQAEELIETIPCIEEDEPDTHSLRLISEHYQAALQSHDCHDLVQLIKTVYAKSQRGGRRVSQIDQRYRKRAEDLLHGELSVALGIPMSEVQPYIAHMISKNTRVKA